MAVAAVIVSRCALIHVCYMSIIIEYMYISNLSKYTLDGFVVNANTIVTFLTFTATTGIINQDQKADDDLRGNLLQQISM